MKHTNPDSILATGALVSRAALAEAAIFAARLTPRRANIPVLGNILIQERKGALMLRSTDLDVETTVMLDAAVAPGFAATVPGYEISRLIKKSKTDDVTIDLDGEKTAFGFNDLRVSVETCPVADFPEMEAGKFKHSFTVEALLLRDYFDRVRFAISTEATRYYLNGIYLHFVEKGLPDGGDALRFVACDGHRLAKYEIPAPKGTENMPGVIIPHGTVEQVIAASKIKSLAGSNFTIKVGENRIMFKLGRYTILSKIIDGTFPDYGRIIPTGNDKRLGVQKDELIRMIEGVSSISSERGRAIKLSMADGKLTGSVVNPDTGTSAMTINCEYAAEPLEIGFNSVYLLDNLAEIKGNIAVFDLSDSGSPTLIRGTGMEDCGLSFVLMPMRV